MTFKKAEADVPGKTQHKKFVEAARELGADDDEKAFDRIVKKVAKATEKHDAAKDD